MNRYVISIGSNSADRDIQLAKAINWLSSIAKSIKASSVYCTESINHVDNEYMNAVAVCESEHSHNDLNDMLKQYEINCGRSKESKLNGVIPIDLDIVIALGNVVRPGDFDRQYFQIGWNQIKKRWQNINDSDR